MDNLEFPRFMCRPGGLWQLETGLYEVRTVADKEEAKQALADGWLFSQYDKPAEKQAEPEEPTAREKLEAEARELGLTWRKNATDESLSKLIAEAKK